uniref:Uncharacterized protein n=1 Tax=Solibacter usitatus (strain Ellin6076) TaxID=234267 RepID=Q01TR3_SOLUE
MKEYGPSDASHGCTRAPAKLTWADGAGGGEAISTERARIDPASGGEVMSTAYKRIHKLLGTGQDAVFDTSAAKSNARKAALGIAR